MSKLRKALEKRLKNTDIGIGFTEPTDWIDTGSYVLNNIISGDFHKGFPLGKVMILAGDSGAGKSLIAANIAKHAQSQGVFPIFLDTEHALDTSFLQGVGVDVSEDAMERMEVITVGDVQKAVNEVLAAFDEIYGDSEDRPKLLFILDSLGMLLTDKEGVESDKGEMKADMGAKAKALRLLIRMLTPKLAKANAGFIATNHVYDSSDMYGNAQKKMSGGQGMIYAASIVLTFAKKEIKENAKAETEGVYIRTKCEKTRFTKPFRRVELVVPYETGIDPYSGLLEAFLGAGLISQSGAWYTEVATGEKFQRKNFKPVADRLLAVGKVNIGVSDSQEEDGNTEILMEDEV